MKKKGEVTAIGAFFIVFGSFSIISKISGFRSVTLYDKDAVALGIIFLILGLILVIRVGYLSYKEK